MVWLRGSVFVCRQDNYSSVVLGEPLRNGDAVSHGEALRSSAMRQSTIL